MKKILLLSLTLICATELEVDGNLKVTGNVDVQNNPIKNVGPPTTLTDAVNGQVLQDALRETGPFEFMFIYIFFHGSSNGSHTPRYTQWAIPTAFNTGDIYWSDDAVSKLNELSQEGWIISNIKNVDASRDVYQLRRSLEDSE